MTRSLSARSFLHLGIPLLALGFAAPAALGQDADPAPSPTPSPAPTPEDPQGPALSAHEQSLLERLTKNADPGEIHEFMGFGKLGLAAKEKALALIARGLDAHPEWVEPTGPQDMSRLELAVSRGQVEIVSLLLERGAEPGGRELARGRRKLARRRVPLLLATGVDRLPLYESGADNVPGIVSALLAAGAKADEADEEGRRAIFGAARGSLEVVKLLLAAGASLKSEDPQGRGVLHHAAEGGQAEIVSLFLSKGLEPDAADAEGRTPLSLCTSPAVAERLLAGGAQLKRRAPDGLSALDLAVWHGRVELTALLRARGAELSLASAAGLGDLAAVEAHLTPEALATPLRGARPLQWAVRAEQRSAAARLLAAGADPNARDALGAPLEAAVAADSVELLTLLLEAGADPNVLAGPGKDAPVHHVARRRSLALLQALAPYKPDMNLAGASQQTPLHLIVREGQDPARVLLALKLGATVDAPDNAGRTALHWAIFSGRNNREVIAALLAAGADPLHRPPVGGKSCVELAEWAGRTDVLDLLRAKVEGGSPPK